MWHRRDHAFQKHLCFGCFWTSYMHEIVVIRKFYHILQIWLPTLDPVTIYRKKTEQRKIPKTFHQKIKNKDPFIPIQPSQCHPRRRMYSRMPPTFWPLETGTIALFVVVCWWLCSEIPANDSSLGADVKIRWSFRWSCLRY